ncbi:hypothetical protein SAMN04487948_102157 [Halogranum amylolyticum]|uniref:DUF1059 domain-containing protein n=1 Tax=Halogranum amylolyticum TaxID=660520 RepID=A0A1H8P9E1_9EURY|nr:hypothetical protein [Halogranum amylolyticum]SEO38364.1 hypothetical protein SAMN04487948_102157 [Halogranum amylolyticum]
MKQCSRSGCAWQTFAPSPRLAREQYLSHLVEAHTREVDADVPEGMVQVHVGDEWVTVSPDEATDLHRYRSSHR